MSYASVKLAISENFAAQADQALGPLADSPRKTVLESIKKALITSRLTLSDQGAGSDPYDSQRGRNPGSVWTQRRRF